MKKINLMEQLAQGADLPGEPLPGLPIVEISGDRRVLVEHHSGVTAYCSTQIGIKVKFGEILVCGNCLEFTRMTRHQLIINGQIDSVVLRRRKRK